MAEHTMEDYGKLLLEYLNRMGIHAVLSLYASKDGYLWQGDMWIPRPQLIDPYNRKKQMNNEIYISVNDMGDIRLHYSEPIVFDLEKKARSEARKAAEQAAEEERLNSLTPMEEEDFRFDCDDDIDFGEYEEAYDWAEEAENSEPADEEEEALSDEEDDEHISERKQLQVLETLSAANSRLYIHGRSNETQIYFSAYREMDSCSRNSAQKAVRWICDELLCACSEIEWMANELQFHRMPVQEKKEEWYDEWLTDSFEHVEAVCRIRDKEREIEESLRKQEKVEVLLDVCEDERRDEVSESVYQFRKMAADAFRIELQNERERRELLQQEIDELKGRLVRP